jgi:hypothetical protein
MIGADRVLGWPRPWPDFCGIGFLGLMIWAAYRWLLAVQRRENRTTGTIADTLFGNVEQKPSGWEVELAFAPTGENILVSSIEGTVPTERQRTTFREILEMWEQVARQIEDSLDAYGEDIVPRRPRNLKYNSLILDAERNEWSVQFDVVGSKAQWGFSADFRGGTLETLEDLH